MRHLLFPICCLCALALSACSTTPKEIETSVPKPANAPQTTDHSTLPTRSELPSSGSAHTQRVCKLQHQTAIYQAPFVLSSLQSLELSNGHILVVFETDRGNIQAMHITPNRQILSNAEIAQFAQIACTENIAGGYRIGMIRRDPQTASYTLDIQSYDPTGSPTESWNATARGFVPDPGSRCAFLAQRKLIVNGTRPRGDRPPYHGLFILESSSLTQLEGAVHNEVELLSGSVATDGVQLLTREIRRDTDTPSWTQVLYRLDENNSLSEVLAGDFVLSDKTIVTRDGCIQAEPAFCIPEVKLTDARRLSNHLFELKTKNTAYFVEKAASGFREILRSDDMDIYPVNAGLWLIATPDPKRPDIGTELHIATSGFDCTE